MSDSLRFWRTFIYSAAAALVLAGVAMAWDSEHGFTKLPRFGTALAAQSLPSIQSLPLALYNGSGYDGQYYAQLAINPDVRSPEVQAAMDNARYRGQRILLPLVAHLLGAGNPWWTLQVYSLLNVAFWIALAWLLHVLTAAGGLTGLARWSVAMLGLGVLESVHLALTDLPAMVFIVGGMICVQREQFWRAGALFAVAGLIRETSLLAAIALAPVASKDWKLWSARSGPMILAVLPVCLWALFVRQSTSAILPTSGVANFDWPGAAILRHLADCIQTVLHGEPHYRHLFAPALALGLAYQSFFIFKTARATPNSWTLMGVSFAILFWFLGENVWEGYWAVARACLPMVLAYCLTIPVDRYFLWRLLLPNLCLVHGIMRFFSSTAQ